MADLYERLKQLNRMTTRKAVDPVAANVPAQADANTELLLNIPGISRGRDLLDSIQKRDDAKQRFLDSIGFETITNEGGSCAVRDVFYSARDLLYPPDEITAPELIMQSRDERFANIHPDEVLFLDTETTGLAGGTGTVPFLIGIGYFEKDGFHIRQYLMRDYDEELPALLELESVLNRFKAISTYNGKAFDVPILNTRFLLNRMRSQIADLPHADLLFPARRYWRDFLPDCSLGSVESGILGRTRTDDIPGSLIPYVYFDFLRGVRIERMRPVFNHNADDIFSLAGLAARTCWMLRNPLDDALHGQEIAALGRIFAVEGDLERACACLERALERTGIPTPYRFHIRKRLSIFYKRRNLFEKARPLWIAMIRDEPEDGFAYIELAKYYEHKEKDWTQALQLTEEALGLAQIAPSNDNTRIDLLTHRLRRLQNRLGLRSSERE